MQTFNKLDPESSNITPVSCLGYMATLSSVSGSAMDDRTSKP